ncbi:unnamed protein product [Diplocarpon coronariae]|nr:hypothetical protein JHW43_000011 [Diplocarpon mali]
MIPPACGVMLRCAEESRPGSKDCDWYGDWGLGSAKGGATPEARDGDGDGDKDGDGEKEEDMEEDGDGDREDGESVIRVTRDGDGDRLVD